MRKMHGTKIKLPVGYAYTLVPPTALIKPMPTSTSAITDIAQSRDFVKVLVALFQVIYSSWTLYEARGNQVELFGPISFSLTVAPYAVMSVINLMGSLLVPVYPTVFLVRSEVMNEAESRVGGEFGGVVGSLQPQALKVNSLTTGQVTDDLASARYLEPACARFERIDLRVGCLTFGREGWLPIVRSRDDGIWKICLFAFSFFSRAFALFCLIVMISIITFGIMLYLSHSRARLSIQQLLILAWLVDGSAVGLLYGINFRRDLWTLSDKPRMRIVNEMIQRVAFSTLAIGGLVVVGMMIKEYGDCRRL